MVSSNKQPIPTEDQEQIAVVQYLDLLKIDFCAVPNGGHRHKAVAAKLKAAGVKPGVPDLLLFTIPKNLPRCRGVAIEMKRRKGGQVSKHQKEWLKKLEKNGWYCFVCHGSDEAIDIIDIIYVSPTQKKELNYLLEAQNDR